MTRRLSRMLCTLAACTATLLPPAAQAAQPTPEAAAASARVLRQKIAGLYVFLRAASSLPGMTALPGGLLACDAGGSVTLAGSTASFTDCVNSLDPASRWNGSVSSGDFVSFVADIGFADLKLAVSGPFKASFSFPAQTLTTVRQMQGTQFQGGMYTAGTLDFKAGTATQYSGNVFMLGFPTLMVREPNPDGSSKTTLASMNAILSVNGSMYVIDTQDSVPVEWTDGGFPSAGVVSLGEMDGSGIHAVRFKPGNKMLITNMTDGSSQTETWTSRAMQAALAAVLR